MRFKYYKLTLRQMKLKKAFVFFLLTFLISYFCIYMFNEKIEPSLKTVCNSNAKKIAFKSSNDAVLDCIQNIQYDDLITLEKNSENKVTVLNANVAQINKLVSEISYKIHKNIEKNKESKIKLPLSEVFSMRIIGARGPKIKVYTLVEGNVEVNFKSKFEEAGINQTNHTLYVEIVTNIETIAPLFSETSTYTNNIMIAQTVIVSDTPNTYYNIKGVDNIDTRSILNKKE